MSIAITQEVSGLVTVNITGQLRAADLTGLQKSALAQLPPGRKVRILVVVENFQGWEKGGDWGDPSLQLSLDPFIERMAIVGEQKWEGLMVMFTGKGYRKFPIEYFKPGEMARARAWLDEGRQGSDPAA